MWVMVIYVTVIAIMSTYVLYVVAPAAAAVASLPAPTTFDESSSFIILGAGCAPYFQFGVAVGSIGVLIVAPLNTNIIIE